MAEQSQASAEDGASPSESTAHPEQVTGELMPEQVERVVERAAARIISASFFRGPLPSPEAIAAYENAMPGLAERCVKMAEKEQDFRHESRRTELRHSNERARDGQRLGAIIAILFLVGAVWVTLAGYWIAGAILGGADLIALVSIFVTGKYFGSRDEHQHSRHQHDDDEDDDE